MQTTDCNNLTKEKEKPNQSKKKQKQTENKSKATKRFKEKSKPTRRLLIKSLKRLDLFKPIKVFCRNCFHLVLTASMSRRLSTLPKNGLNIIQSLETLI
ncbi:MAG: hypothetical protein U5N85_07730 [Arcicella sp.]|nr:hypothetical protein [Arcicella sp.]